MLDGRTLALRLLLDLQLEVLGAPTGEREGSRCLFVDVLLDGERAGRG